MAKIETKELSKNRQIQVLHSKNNIILKNLQFYGFEPRPPLLESCALIDQPFYYFHAYFNRR